LERLVAAGIDFIEVGFLDDRREFDMNRSIMPNTQAVNKIYGSVKKEKSLLFAMIDYGTCSIDNLQPCKDTCLDGIRVIFKEHKMEGALEFCRQIKDKGYKVFANMVSVTTYNDEKLKEFAEKVNTLGLYGVSMVDTYGLMHQYQLMHIAITLDKYLNQEIRLAFHAHNNFQMGYANSIEFLQYSFTRNISADGSLFGMGKSAGNTTIELLAMFMNEYFKKKYDLSQILEAIDNVIMDIYHKQYWGYNIKFYISAANKCHPNYVAYLLKQKTLSIKQINEILQGLTFEKKLLYDAKYAEQVYLDYQNIHCDDKKSYQELKEIFGGHNILVLGPGKNAIGQKQKIDIFIKETEPVVIAVNYVPEEIKTDFIFLTKAKRYTQLLNEVRYAVNKQLTIIATSNVTKVDGNFKYVLNYESLIDKNTEIIDNSLIMLLKAMLKCNVPEISLAGFDGYSKSQDNYFNTSREYSFAKEKASYLNTYVKKFLMSVANEIEVKFITNSHYATLHRRK
jgi:4-hydroxy 2-oxovalerate aldolase